MPRALAVVWELVREANRRGQAAAALPMLLDWDTVLGLDWRRKPRAKTGWTADDQRLLDERQAARKARDGSARTRSGGIAARGIEVEDTAQGPRWK